MKKRIIALLLPVMLVLPAIFVANQHQEVQEVKASAPEYNIPLEEGESFDYSNAFFDDFDDGIDFASWYIKDRAWGQVNGRKNGGVVPDNVFYDNEEGTAILRTAGDYYAENHITPASNAESENGTRTGADLVSKFWTYPGRYEVRMKVAPRYGACTSLWTYIEYAAVNKDGDHHNHEIDIELPWNGDFRKVSFGNYASLSDHTSYKASVDYLNDGEYHTYGFDWYYNENTDHKLINYYIDGVILKTISTSIPFYKTKVNIGVWVPDSNLAGTPPRYDQAFVDVDYFKYIPFQNNLHQDSDYPSTYNVGHVASQDQYPTESTPNLDRNYFPNGTFSYVNRSESKWMDPTVTGLTFSNASVSKSYDRSGNSKSGGVLLNADTGSVIGYVDSCHKGQRYRLTCDYRYAGYVVITYYDANDQVLAATDFNLDNSSSWAIFDQTFSIPEDTAYISIQYVAGNAALILDNIRLLMIGTDPIIEDENTNHFMTLFHNNPTVLTAFGTDGTSTSSKKTDLVLNDMDYTSSTDWRVSVAKYEVKSTNYISCITMGSSSNNIATSSDPTYQAIYNAVNGECEISGIQSVIHSTNYIEDIRDLSLYWNSCDAGRVYVCYKTKTSDWSYLTDFSGTSANDGTNEKQSLNRRQLIVDINNEDFTDKLFGKDAQIAFMFSSNTDDTSKSYMCLQGIYVNKIKAIKAKMNYWNDNETPLCSGPLTNPKSLEYADLYFTNYSLSVAEANEMNELIPSKSLTYFSQFEYLCGIAGINVKEHPSFYGNNNLFNSTNIGTIVVVLASTACLLLTTTIFMVYRTKRREQ